MVPTVAPAAPRCLLLAGRDSPCFSTLVPRRHVQKATGSAFFRYRRDKTAQAGDFPRQLSLNFKPPLLSLSRAVLGSWGREQNPGSLPTAASPNLPRNPPAPLPLPTPHHVITWGQAGQSPRGGGNPGQLLLAWVTLLLNKAAKPCGAEQVWDLCCGSNGVEHPQPPRAQAFILKLLQRIAFPPSLFILHPGAASSCAFISAFVPPSPHCQPSSS